jgi:hypothetical protein
MVSSIQKEKAELFLKYHHDKETLVLLNSWDIGSSKLIEASGYKAIATTSNEEWPQIDGGGLRDLQTFFHGLALQGRLASRFSCFQALSIPARPSASTSLRSRGRPQTVRQ